MQITNANLNFNFFLFIFFFSENKSETWAGVVSEMVYCIFKVRRTCKFYTFPSVTPTAKILVRFDAL